MTAFPQRLGVALCALAISASAYAQNPTAGAEPFGLDEAVRLAIANNPTLAASVRDIAAAKSGERSARAPANPEVSFSPGLSPGGSDTEGLIQQPLELNGTRSARTAVASARRRAVEATAVITLREVVFATKSAYLELARARELEALALELASAAEEFDRLTRRQVEVGTRPGIDQVQTGIEAVRARQEVTRAGSRTSEALATLNTAMGRPPGTMVGRLEALSTLVVSPVPGAADADRAVEQRAEITVAEAAQQEARQEARLARAEGRPDLAPQIRAGSLIRGVHDAGIGISITLPVLDFGSRRNRVRQAEQTAEAQALRLKAAGDAVRQEVAHALSSLQAADAVVKGYQAGVVDQARRLLDASRTGLQAGQTSVLALLEAQRTWRAVQMEYTNALADRAAAAAALERATGTVPATLLNQATPKDRRSQ